MDNLIPLVEEVYEKLHSLQYDDFFATMALLICQWSYDQGFGDEEAILLAQSMIDVMRLCLDEEMGRCRMN